MTWHRLIGESVEGSTSGPALSPSGSQGLAGPLRRRALAVLGVLLVVYVIVLGVRYLPAPSTPPGPSFGVILPPQEDVDWVRANPYAPVAASPFRFTEITQSAGIDFVQVSGMTEAKHFPTAYGSGVAMVDIDNDGRLDLYFATTTFLLPGKAKSASNRLYHNLGGNRFEDATKTSGLGYAGFCHGIVVGDIDNDGDQDIFLCNYGSNVLYVNNGKGAFQEISKQAGIDSPGWSTAGAFLDYDNDGDLDLYVAKYGSWKLPDDDHYCPGSPSFFLKGPPPVVRVYCSPKSIRPARHTLYRNNGNHTFTDVTASAGVARTDGRGLGVVAADLNEDGRTDLYVTNDMCANFLFLNRGDGTFEDATDSSGAGYGPNGQMRAGMGADAEDVDGDGRADLLVTNFWAEGTALFANLGQGLFQDRGRGSGMFFDSVYWVGWGCALADFDNDSWPDCFATTGHVDDNLGLLGYGEHTHAQPPLLHHNRRGSKFWLATRNAGSYFDADHAGRGAAFGDIDNDGKIDIVVNHIDVPPAVLRNDTQTNHHWVRLNLEGTRSNRDGVGARVEVETAERTVVRQRKGGASYLSSHDPRLLIGLGKSEVARRVTIRWPSGQVDEYTDLHSETTFRLREGATAPMALSTSSTRDEGGLLRSDVRKP